jgi:mono/diheme cytochrome c family protein
MKSGTIPGGSILKLRTAAGMILTVVILGLGVSTTLGGDHPLGWWFHKHFHQGEVPPGQIATMNGGYWLWVRSPEQEKVVVMSLFNRYCIRCHGVDGRGVWDIPGVPDFTDVRWQACRTDDQIVRIIIEGRGAVMPQFRGALALDEAWGIAHYLRTFVPGTEMSRPDLSTPSAPAAARTSTPASTRPVIPPPRPAAAMPAVPPPAPSGSSRPLTQ